MCKPTIDQQVVQTHISTEHSHKNKQQNEPDGALLVTRKLTWDEKNAIRRHDVARKEREALSKDARAKTKEELRDERTLTQTGFAFWSAIGYRTFHLRNCTKLDHISGLRGYARCQDAVRAGLTPCKLCKPSSKYDIKVSVPIYHRERQGETVETLEKLCNVHGFSHHFEMPDFYIETAVGKWKIDIRTHPVSVYHINLALSPDETVYHKQHRLFLSLSDTFEYIRRHENILMEKMRSKENKMDEPDSRFMLTDQQNTGEIKA